MVIVHVNSQIDICLSSLSLWIRRAFYKKEMHRKDKNTSFGIVDQ